MKVSLLSQDFVIINKCVEQNTQHRNYGIKWKAKNDFTIWWKMFPLFTDAFFQRDIQWRPETVS